MKKIVILGSTGMLGNAVADYFLSSDKYVVMTSYRNSALKRDSNSFYFDALKSDFESIPECDYVLNCIGIIKPFMEKNVIDSIYVNSVFPRKLSQWCNKTEKKLIQL